MLSIPDIFTNIVGNVETIYDLINLCNVSKETKTYCLKYTTEYIFKLLQKESFRNSYYSKLSHAIDTSNENDVKFLLSFYPVGKFYGKNYKQLNRLQKICYNIGTTIKYNGKIDQNLDRIWKYLFKYIFLPPNYLINEFDRVQLKDLSSIHFFNLGFYRENYYPYGFWDIETFFELYDLFKFFHTRKLEGSILQSNIIEYVQTSIFSDSSMFSVSPTLNYSLPSLFKNSSSASSTYSSSNSSDSDNSVWSYEQRATEITDRFPIFTIYEYKEYFSVLIDYIIDGLKIYKTYDQDLFNDIITVYIKKVSYFISSTNDDDIDDFLPYADISLQILYMIEKIDKDSTKKIIQSCFDDLYGMDINNYNQHMEYGNYKYLKQFLNHFNPQQIGGQSKCKSNKISRVMREFKSDSLKSRWGYSVTNPKQAIAIALSEANKYCK